MFIGLSSPNNQPDPNLYNAGIPPVNPAELPPQMGNTEYPGDETGRVTEGLTPPATAGAEQDMQMASNEASKHAGALAVPAANAEPDAPQPDTPTGSQPAPPDATEVTEAPESPDTTVSGGDGPNDPPDTPKAHGADMFPEREPIAAPDFYALSERTPFLEEAREATITLLTALGETTTQNADYSVSVPRDESRRYHVSLTLPTQDGYLLLHPTPDSLRVTRHTFKPRPEPNAPTTIDANFHPPEIHDYALAITPNTGELLMARSHTTGDFETDATRDLGAVAFHDFAMRNAQKKVNEQEFNQSMPNMLKPLSGPEAAVLKDLLEQAAVTNRDFTSVARNIYNRCIRKHPVPAIDVINAARDLEQIVAEASRRPEFSSEIEHENPDVEAGWQFAASAQPGTNERADFSITIGHDPRPERAEGPLGFVAAAAQIPDTIEEIEHPTPHKTPFITIQTTTPPNDKFRASTEAGLHREGIQFDPATLTCIDQVAASVERDMLVMSYTTGVLVDGTLRNTQQFKAYGDAANIQDLKLFLRNPRYFNEIEGWLARFQANQQS